ncbi:hypothetical protein GQ53DRAFT_751584 [Thozetella sp. PMI_491]|nr:hypothetical protein GQ53DRAFT_751584 [Thozetella sp. PMI_491]
MKFPCPRCKRNYDSNDGLAAHLLAPSEEMCQVRDKADEESDGDPEAGISDSTVEILNERKQNTKIDSWNALWKKLFPLDAHPKDHYFVPPVELDEVKEDFDGSWDRLRADLQAELGAASAHILDSVADRCQEHIRGVLEQSQDRVGECRQTHKRRRQESKVSMPSQGEPGAVDALGRHTYARLPGGSSNASNVSASPVDEPPETIDSGMWSQSMGPMPTPMSTRNYGSLAIPAPQPAGITVPGPVAPFHGTYSIGMRNESPKGQSPDQLDSAKVLDTPAVSASMEHFFVPSGTTEFDAYNLELANQYNGANGYDAYSHFPGMPYGNGSG